MAEQHKRQMEFVSVGTETLGAWAELNQRVMHDLTRLAVSAVEEGTRTTSELQHASLAAWRNVQDAAMRWQTLWPEAFRDPLRWYQRALEPVVKATHEGIDLGRRNAETTMRSLDRLQHHSDEAARTLEETFREGATKMRDIQSKTETLRVA
jgi:hypothetical protein